MVDFMLEQALFEEEQQSILKARKIYETLQNEIAPDLIKSLIAFINFEKRQNNTEKVKELYFKAYSNALSRNEVETLAFLSIQYARYLAFKCQDPVRADDILNKAMLASKGSLILYLSYVNFLKHLPDMPDAYTKIVTIFERGLD